MDLKVIINIVTVPFLCIVFGLAAAALLFLPQPAIRTTWLQYLQQDYSWIVWACFYLCSVGLIAHIVRWLINCHNRRRDLKACIERLNSLSEGERHILAFCLIQKQQSINLPLNYLPATALVQKGILSRARIGKPLLWPYTIVDDVWKEILKPAQWERIVGSDPPTRTSPEWFRVLLAGQDDYREFMNF